MNHNRVVLTGAVLMLLFACAGAERPTPPAQPKTGPGGAEYRHAKVVATLHGTGPTAYWLYEPAQPTPASAPLVIFTHGWLAYVPGDYVAWTEHIVRRGNLVIYPVYQDSPFTPAENWPTATGRPIRFHPALPSSAA